MNSKSAVINVVHRLGGQSALARILNTRQSTVWEWSHKGRVPDWRIDQIIAAAARLDPPVVLRPDDFFDLPPVTLERTQAAAQVAG